MQNTINIVRVFIGSPGGLDAERQLARKIVDQINQSHSENWGCQLQLIGWEATLPGHKRAQSLINVDLDKCTYFIGILWDHWGSLPDTKSKYTSGFEEEFERAKEHLYNQKMKDIALFFKEIDSSKLRDPGKSLQKVLKFREQCISQKELMFQSFDDLDNFGDILRAKLESIGWLESRFTKLNVTSGDAGANKSEEIDKSEKPEEIEARILQSSSHNFLKSFSDKNSLWSNAQAEEIARVRLIALSLRLSENDQEYIGNHDANLLFSEESKIDFSEQELRALINSSVASYQHQNQTLWHWVKESTSEKNFYEPLIFLTWIGNDAEMENSLRILTLLNQQVPDFENFKQKELISFWLITQSSQTVFKCAIEYLKKMNNEQHIPILTDLLPAIQGENAEAVMETIVSLTASKSRKKALDLLVSFDCQKLDMSLTDKLFSNSASVSTSQLKQCLQLKNDSVRRHALESLIKRNELSVEMAKNLIEDTNFSIKRMAIEALRDYGEVLDNKWIRDTLTRKINQNSLFGLLGNSANDDDQEYKTYQKNELMNLNKSELFTRAKNASLFSGLEQQVLYERYTKAHIDEIRENLSDGFENYYDAKLSQFEGVYGKQNSSEKPASIFSFMKSNALNAAFTSLTKFMDKGDLELVRNLLDKKDIHFSSEALHYLSKMGNFSDTKRIMSFSEKYKLGESVNITSLNQKYAEIGKALYSVSRHRLVDLLNLNIETALLRDILKRIPLSNYKAFDQEVITTYLNHDDTTIRKIVACKCSLALSKTALEKLLQTYKQRNQKRFYNSIHWLDTGVSLPNVDARMLINATLKSVTPM